MLSCYGRRPGRAPGSTLFLSRRTLMMSVNIEDKVRIPSDLTDLEAFRRWARSDQFPQRGRFAFLRDDVWVDLSMGDAFTHNQVKAEISEVLHALVKSGKLGYFFPDRMLMCNVDV